MVGEKKLIGTISHFYPKINVAVIDLSDALKVGDKILIERHEDAFEQVVSSMEIEHKKVQIAKKGQSIGLQVMGKTKEGAKVYKVL